MTNSTNNNGGGDLGPFVIGGLILGGIVLLWRALNGKKKVFISYDHSEDARYKHLLEAWNKNEKFSFEFDNRSPKEPIDSERASVVKAGLSRLMKDAQYMLVIVGEKTYTSKWVDWEIRRALEADMKLKLAAVKIDRQYRSPDALHGAGAAWAYSFSEQNVIDVLNRAEAGKQLQPAEGLN